MDPVDPLNPRMSSKACMFLHLFQQMRALIPPSTTLGEPLGGSEGALGDLCLGDSMYISRKTPDQPPQRVLCYENHMI